MANKTAIAIVAGQGQPLPSGDKLTDADGNCPIALDGSKDFAIENPTSSEKKMWFFTPVAITITKLVAVLIGSSSQSVSWKVFHHTDRSAAGNAVITAATATTSITTGDVITTFDDATIPADSFVWIETTAQAGTVTDFFLHCDFTRD